MMLVEVKNETMICASPDGFNGNLNGTPSQEGGDGGNALTKRRGIFDSEDNERSNGIW